VNVYSRLAQGTGPQSGRSWSASRLSHLRYLSLDRRFGGANVCPSGQISTTTGDRNHQALAATIIRGTLRKGSAMSNRLNVAPNDLSAIWMPFTANRQFKQAPRMLVAAKDMHYTSSDGRQILDGTAGLWCVNAGHCRP